MNQATGQLLRSQGSGAALRTISRSDAIPPSALLKL
jgi:hypothetical protein